MIDKRKWDKYLKSLGSEDSNTKINFDTYDSTPICEDVKYTFKLDFKTVLCVGCGFGQEAYHYEENGYNVVGITLSDADIEIGIKKLKVNLIKMDMHDLEYNDLSFDLVFMRQVLEHALSPYIALREAARVSKKYVAIFLPYIYEWSDYEWHLIIPTKYQLESLMKKFNFQLIDYFIRFKDERKWNDYCYLFERIKNG